MYPQYSIREIIRSSYTIIRTYFLDLDPKIDKKLNTSAFKKGYLTLYP